MVGGSIKEVITVSVNNINILVSRGHPERTAMLVWVCGSLLKRRYCFSEASLMSKTNCTKKLETQTLVIDQDLLLQTTPNYPHPDKQDSSSPICWYNQS